MEHRSQRGFLTGGDRGPLFPSDRGSALQLPQRERHRAGAHADFAAALVPSSSGGSGAAPRMTARSTAPDEQIPTDKLLAYLREQRWFGEKGQNIRSVRIADSIPVRWPAINKEYSVARVTVETGEGAAS